MPQKKKRKGKGFFAFIKKKEAQYEEYKAKQDIAQMDRMRTEIEKLKLQREKFEERQKLQSELSEARGKAGKQQQSFWNEAIFGRSQ
jgi:hypothetical protein